MVEEVNIEIQNAKKRKEIRKNKRYNSAIETIKNSIPGNKATI